MVNCFIVKLCKGTDGIRLFLYKHLKQKASYMFQVAPFLSSSNIYEVNIRQYTQEGTFSAFQKNLPRLQKMGVEILWLMPVYPIGQTHRKGELGSYYSIRDFEDINPEFGTKDDFRSLIEAAHDAGMKLIIDWVANHAAWDNVWTKDHPDFFLRNENGEFLSPYDWSDVIQIDHSNKAQQIRMMEAMAYWVREFNIDGFRADLAHLTPLPFWIDARMFLQNYKTELIWLAETEEINYHQAFDISFTWNWMHTSEKYIKNGEADHTFIDVIKNSTINFPENALRLYFTSNHDENSWNGTEYDKYERFAQAMAVMSCTLPSSVPLIYSGQEIPNRKRLAFFEKDHLNWDNTLQLNDFYANLFSFRKLFFSNKNYQNFKFHFLNVSERIIAYIIADDLSSCIVVLNFSDKIFSDHINAENLSGEYIDLFSGETIQIHNNFFFSIPSSGYKIYYSK